MNWDAAAFFLTLLIAIMGYFGWNRRNRNKTDRQLHFDITVSTGHIKESLLQGTPRRLTMERISLKNKGSTELKGIKLRLAPTSEVWSTEVGSTKLLAKEAVRITDQGNSLLIEIDDFPSGETAVIHVLSNDWYVQFDRLKSENSNVVMIQDA